MNFTKQFAAAAGVSSLLVLALLTHVKGKIFDIIVL